MNDYIFPFSTCERPNQYGIVQPFSSIVNFVIVMLLVYFFMKAKSIQLKYVFASFILFELWHTISHMTFIDGSVQQNVVHFLAYNLAFVTLYAILGLTKSSLEIYQILLLIAVVIIDIMVYMYYGGVYIILTGTLLFIVVLVCIYNMMPSFVIYYVIALLGLSLLFINEAVNCKWLLQKWPNFPFHIFIEIYGLVLFYFLGKKLLSLDK